MDPPYQNVKKPPPVTSRIVVQEGKHTLLPPEEAPTYDAYSYMRHSNDIQDGYSGGSVQLVEDSLPQGVLPTTIHEQSEEEDEEDTETPPHDASQPPPEPPTESLPQPPENPNEPPQDNLLLNDIKFESRFSPVTNGFSHRSYGTQAPENNNPTTSYSF